MTERDPGLARAYRRLAKEDSPPAVDAAILAASRRAVGSRPGGLRRWAGPLSIAAVLVLGIGISLRMQLEKPGIETSLPSEYALPTPAPEEPKASAAPAPQAAPPRQPEPVARDAAPVAKPKARTAPRRDPAPELSARQAPAEQAAAPVPEPTPAETAAQASPPPMRMKREAFSADADRAAAPAAAESRAPAPAIDPLLAELERIAKLRAEGRHDEADKALDEFRRRNPGYRVPEAMRGRIERR